MSDLDSKEIDALIEPANKPPVGSNDDDVYPNPPPLVPSAMSSTVQKNWNSPKARMKFILKSSWKFLFTLSVPFLLLPIFWWDPPEVTYKWTNEAGQAVKGKPTKAPHALYIMALMCTYWISECIPLAITSLIPYALVPLFGITDTDTITSEFFKDTNIFLLFGCIMALSFEYSNLHNRIAFFVMKSVGAKPSILLFGLMTTCMLLSCWMNNTSTTAMMTPVILPILEAYSDKLVPKERPEELAMKFGGDPAHRSKTVQVNDSPIMMDETGSTGLKTEEDKIAIPGQIISENPSSLRVVYASSTKSTVTEALHVKKADIEYWKEVIKSKKQYIRNLEIMFYLGAAFASNIGGSGVLTGTGTNVIALAALNDFKKDINNPTKTASVKDKDKCIDPTKGWLELDFMRWSMLNVIPMVVNTLIVWIFLAIYFQGVPSRLKHFWTTAFLRREPTPEEIRQAKQTKELQSGIRKAISKKHKDLGPMNLNEIGVFTLFLLLVFLWVFKNPTFGKPKPAKYSRSSDPITDDFNLALKTFHPKCKDNSTLKLLSSWGWARFFGDKCDESYVHDYVPTLLICFLLFIIPRRAEYYRNFLQGGLADGLDDPLLPVDFVAKNITWGPIIMLGGGFGMSATVKLSGLDKVMSGWLQRNPTLHQMSVPAINASILTGVAILTSLASNTATALIVCPVLLQLARTKSVPPPYLLVPPTVSASYAFALPISTPPNAIVYDKANMKQKDMFIPGFFITIITNGILFLFTISWYHYMFNLDKYGGFCDYPKSKDGSRSLSLIDPSTHFGND